ncbi:MAG: hypothetical protein ACRD3T_13100, partial [Terriglobia bacterium]
LRLIRESKPASKYRRVPFLAATFALGGTLFAAAPRHKSAAVGTGFSDQGTFVLTIAGQEVGREKFQIESTRSGVEARAMVEFQVQRNGKALHFRASPDLVLNSRLDPLTYTWSQRGSETSQLRMDLRRSPATVRYHTVKGGNDDRTIQLPHDVIILDDNVIHQYEIAVLRFYMTSGGRQVFHAFIPQEALPGLITIQDMGEEPPAAQSKGPILRHLLLITDQARIDLWVDQDHRIQRVAIPAAQFQAVRKD